MQSAVWPAEQEYLRTLHVMHAFVGLSLTAKFISDRTPRSIERLRSLSIPRWLVIFVLIDTWAFYFVSGSLVLGVGTSLNERACEATIVTTFVFYIAAKALTFLFLSERVYIVNLYGDKGKIRRSKSPMYIISLTMSIIWTMAAAGLIGFKNHFIRSDGACIVGLKRRGSLGLIASDFVLTSILTSAFIIPIIQSHSRPLRRLAIRSLICSAVGFISTAANLITLIALGGEQLGFISAGSCALDVFINATLLHIIVGAEEVEVELISHPKPYSVAFPGISVAIDRATDSTREREQYLSGVRTVRTSVVSSTDRRVPRGDESITEESKASD